MIATQERVIPLEEYKTLRLDKDELSSEVGEMLFHRFGEKLLINPPSFKNDYQWEITSMGWVGYITLTQEFGFYLKPKVPLKNLFGMWEYAYRLKSFLFMDELYTCQSLQEFYEQLASILAKRILDRGRKGYYRTYLPLEEQLPYLRGQLDVRHLTETPWKADLYCHYQEHTPDIEENQILAWTLFIIARSGNCRANVAQVVRRAYRNLQGLVTLTPFTGQACIGRLYNRLNQEYQPLHALSRFFLDNVGPQFEIGDRTMVPFLVNMANLYELFVAEWMNYYLDKNFPAKYRLKTQEQVDITNSGNLYFKIDMVLYDIELNEVRCVLDTKYKKPDSPSESDIYQITAYAQSKSCKEAVLVYPAHLAQPLEAQVGNIHVRNATFSLDGDLEKAGKVFVQELLHSIDPLISLPQGLV